MARTKAIKRTTIRTTARLKNTFDRVIGNLRDTEAFAPLDYVSKESILNASWVWMSEMDPEELARHLVPHVKAIRAIWPTEEGDASEREAPLSADEPVTFSTGKSVVPDKPARRKKRG